MCTYSSGSETKNQRPSDPIARAADLCLSRARAEIELLATVADSPRRSWPVLAAAGVTLDDFTADDALTIALVLRTAATPTGAACDRLWIATTARYLLREIGLWDDVDTRPFVAGSRWSDASLVALLCRVTYDPDLIRHAAARLLAIDARQRALTTPEARCA